MVERLKMIEPDYQLSVRKQAMLLGINRSTFYYHPVINGDSEIANMINEIYLDSDCRYGYRKVTAELHSLNLAVNSKKVLRIMKAMNLQGLYPKKNYQTSIRDKEHKIYPYLLTGLTINRVNQVWSTDITYISNNGKFVYFVAILDLYSRFIVNYQLSAYMDADFCIYTLKNALSLAKPEIFNSDQGSQFTSNNFILELEKAEVKISMDHKGRCFDNIFSERLWRTLKQEAIYYYRPENLKELEMVINDFVKWYNYKRRHQSLDYKRPAEIYYNRN
jgi:putative transposase